MHLKYIQLNENKSIIWQNLWDPAKGVIRGKLIALDAYIRKDERPKINNLSFYLRKLEKGEQCNPKASRRKEIRKITAEIYEIGNRKIIYKIKTKFFEKINKLINF